MSATPKDFLERVVAWPGDQDPGYVNIHYTLTDSAKKMMPGRPFRAVDEAISFVQSITNAPHIKDIYYCLSTQSHTTTGQDGKLRAVRLAVNALLLKAIWLDIDIKPEKGYATLKEAVAALRKFIVDAGLPPPSALVASGGGLHVYWICDRPLSVAGWEPYAFGLRDLAVRHGLKCDAGLTTDAARVLRVPGTYNKKEAKQRPVVLKALGESYDFATALAAVAARGAPLVTAPVTRASKTAPFDLSAFTNYKVPAVLAALNPMAENVSDGLHQDRPLDYRGLIQCPHFLNAMKTGGAGFAQGLWMHDVHSAQFTNKGRALAHSLSKGYSGYSKEATDAMYDRKVGDREAGKGWPGCKAFENDGAKECATCMHRGKITSPLSLCSRVEPPPTDKPPPPMVADKLSEPDADEYDLNLPDGYQLDDEGIICKQVDSVDKDGEPTTQLVKLFQFRVGKMWLSGGLKASCHLKVELGKDGITDLVVPQKAFENNNTLMACIEGQMCLIYTPAEKYVRGFMSSWWAKMVEAEARVKAQPYGWLYPIEGGDEPVGFCYGGVTFKPDGTTEPAGIPDRETKENFTPKGNNDAWMGLLRVITEQHHPGLEVLALAAFSAPLMWIGGERAGILWGWSQNTSAHKSTSVALGQATYGSPPAAKLRAESSRLAIEHRFGIMKNLPIFVDEIRRDDDVKAITSMAGTLTEGGTSAKMLRSGEAQRGTLQWETLMCAGANQDCRKYVMRDGSDGDAGLARVFSFEVEKRGDSHDPAYVTQLVHSLDRNYGNMGLRYAKYIAMNRAAIDKEGKENWKAFGNTVHMTSAERFWMTLCVGLLTAVGAFNDMMGEEFFHYDEVYDFLVTVYKEQREYTLINCASGSNGMGAFNALNKFFNSTLDYQLWTMNMQVGRGRQAITVLHTYTGPIAKDVRVHWVRDARLVHVSKRRLEEFLEAQNPPVNADNVIKALIKNYNAKLVDRIQLTAGIANKGQAREFVIEIPIPAGSDWEPNLMNHGIPQGEGEELPPDPEDTPVTLGISDAATAQAAKDLTLVRSATE